MIRTSNVPVQRRAACGASAATGGWAPREPSASEMTRESQAMSLRANDLPAQANATPSPNKTTPKRGNQKSVANVGRTTAVAATTKMAKSANQTDKNNLIARESVNSPVNTTLSRTVLNEPMNVGLYEFPTSGITRWRETRSSLTMPTALSTARD